MATIKHKWFCTLLGASGSLSGIIASTGCQGGNCTSCMACAGIGFSMIAMLLWGKLKKTESSEQEN